MTRRHEGQLEVARTEIGSPWGHDSFLLDVPADKAAVAHFLQR
jgi:hypothetical protein